MTETQTLTLTDFLLARIAEDEAAAKSALALYGSGTNWPLEHPLDPARVLAECEAKRLIVAMHHPSREYEPDACVLCQWDIDCDAPKHDHQGGSGEWPCHTLRALAAIYADHEDYREEWRA